MRSWFEFSANRLDRAGLQSLRPEAGRLGRRVAGHVLVLARELTYFTEVQVALTRRADLLAYLSANASLLCPFADWQAVFVVDDLRRGGSSVPRTHLKIWFYDPRAISPHLVAGWGLVIPEDLLIASACTERVLLQTGLEAGALLYASEARVLASEILPPQQSERAAVLADIQNLTGLQPRLLTANQRDDLLRQGGQCLALSKLSGLVHYTRPDWRPMPGLIKRWSRGVVFVTVAWLLLGSAVLLQQQRSFKAQQQAMSGPLREVLAENNREQQLIEGLGQLQALFDEAPPVTPVFAALGALSLEHTKLNRLGLVGSQLVLGGESANASAVLAQLSQQPWVADARFDAPVARQAEKDRFVLVITLDVDRLPVVNPVNQEGAETLAVRGAHES